MRRLLKFVVLAAVLWCGWWWLASTGMRAAIDAQVQDMRTQGWQVDMAEPARGGFPFTLRQTLTQIKLTDPDHTTVEMPNLTVSAKAYWPGYATVVLPQEPFVITTLGSTIYLQFDDGAADMRLRPGPALELQAVTFKSGPWQINETSGNLLTAQDLTLSLLQTSDDDAEYSFDVRSTELAPGDLIRSMLNVPKTAPLSFDAYTATGTTRLSRPLDRSFVSGETIVPQTFNLTQAEVTWGDITMRATADLTFDTAGKPDGELVASVQNWRTLLSYARAANVISQQQEMQSGMMLGIFANMSGTPDDLSLTLRAQNGQMNVNGIGLGPAPVLFAP